MHVQKKQSSRFFRFSFFGFTLTELIVVITILAILSVIAFLSFQSYSASARDSVRVSDISNISKALSIFEVYSGKYPEPSLSTVMKFKGGSVWKQGVIGDDIIRATKILSEKPVDPKFSVPYTYSVTVSGNEYQLAGALEGEASIAFSPLTDVAYASSDSSGFAYVKGNYNLKLGVAMSGSSCVAFFLPSLMTADVTSGSLEGMGTGSLIFNNAGNLPASYSGVSGLVLTGAVTNDNYALSGDELIIPGITCGHTLTNTEVGTIAGTLQQIIASSPVGTFSDLEHFATLSDSKTILAAGSTLAKTALHVGVDTNSPLPSFSCAVKPSIPHSGTFNTGSPTTFSQAWQYNSTAEGACRFSCEASYTYNPLTNQCVQQLCTGNLPAHAEFVGGQALGIPIVYSSDASTKCSFTCSTGYTWDGSMCREKSCEAQTRFVGDHQYSVAAINHNASATGTIVVRTPDGNGNITYSQGFSCSLGTLSLVGDETSAVPVCDEHYLLNGGKSGCIASSQSCGIPHGSGTQSWSGSLADWGNCTLVSCNENYTPDFSTNICSANTQLVPCGGLIPANGTGSTSSSYMQTWNGSAWTPSLSWTSSGATCGFDCNTGYTWDGVSACAPNRCSLPWGGTIASGDSVLAYSTASVPYGATCASESRTCTLGVLSGSNTFGACSVTAGANCNASSQTVNTHSYSVGALSHGSGATVVSAGIAIAGGTKYFNVPFTCTNGVVSAGSESFDHTNCNLNYTVSGQSCSANSQVNSCSTPPAGTQFFNGSGSYNISQTWNGTTWLPTETSSYSATPTTGTCLYNCSAAYNYNGSSCAPKVNCVGTWGACSSGTQSYSITTPASNGGTACASAAGATQSCGTPGACGTDNGQNLLSAPTNLCATGSGSTVTGTGPWSWTCTGPGGGSVASCSAQKKINGVCGATTGTCSSGTAGSVSGAGPWNWTCNGSNGGNNPTCSTADNNVAGYWKFDEGNAYDADMTNALSYVPAMSIKNVGGVNVFSDVGDHEYNTSDFIPVDPNKTYTISGLFKSAGSTPSNLYYGLVPYDSNKNMIPSQNVMRWGNDETITSYNSTSITVNQTISGWYTGTNQPYLQLLGFYYDGNTSKVPDAVMWGVGNIAYTTAVGNTITLTTSIPSDISSHIIPGTTKVKNHGAGGTFMYSAAAASTVPNTWTTYSANITGEGFGNGGDIFRLGTRYVQLLFLNNYGQNSSAETQFTNLYFKEAGNTTTDSSGNGSTGTMQGATWGSGKMGNGGYFNGSSYVDLGIRTSLNQNISDFSIGAWTKLDATLGNSDTNYHIFSNELYLSYGYEFRVENTTSSTAGKISFRTSQSGDATSVVSQPNAYPNDHAWHYIMVTKSGTNGTIYIDGVPVSSYSYKVNLLNPVNSSDSAKIGTYSAGSQPWKGRLDEIKFYNRALNAAEVQAIYNAQK